MAPSWCTSARRPAAREPPSRTSARWPLIPIPAGRSRWSRRPPRAWPGPIHRDRERRLPSMPGRGQLPGGRARQAGAALSRSGSRGDDPPHPPRLRPLQDALFELDELPQPPAPRPRFGPVQLARLLGGEEPTPEQATVISAPLEPLAVIAGAGSGKSETMAARLVWLVANGLVQPERVLGLTFTRKAAAELATRVRTRLDALRRVGLVGARARPRGARPSPTSTASPSSRPIMRTQGG